MIFQAKSQENYVDQLNVFTEKRVTRNNYVTVSQHSEYSEQGKGREGRHNLSWLTNHGLHTRKRD